MTRHLFMIPLAVCLTSCGVDRSVPPHLDGNAGPVPDGTLRLDTYASHPDWPPRTDGSGSDLLAPYCGGSAKVEVKGTAVTPITIKGQIGYDTSWWWIGKLTFECTSTSGVSTVAIKVGVQKSGSPQLPATIDLGNLPPGWMLSVVYVIGSPLTSPPPFPGSPDSASFVGSISLSSNGTAMGVCLAGWRGSATPPPAPEVRLYTPPVPLGP
jgi:hypothetical protein